MQALAIIFFFILSSSPLIAEDKDSFLKRFHKELGDQYFKYRYFPYSIEKAEYRYKKSRALGLKDKEYYWRLARLSRYKGKEMEKGEAQSTVYRKGMKKALLALETAPNESNVHLWYAASLGSYMITDGIRKTFKWKNTVRSEFQKSAELDPKNDLAFLGLAYWYFYMPRFFGGDTKKAFYYLKKAKKLNRKETSHDLMSAIFNEELGNYEEAKDLYKMVLLMKNSKDFSEMILDHYKAQKKLLSPLYDVEESSLKN